MARTTIVASELGFSPAATAVANSAALQAVLTAASASGKAIVYMPPGTYSVSTTITIPSNVTLRGAGMGKTILYMPAASFTNTTVGAYSATSMLLDCSGLLVSPYTANTKIELCDFSIESEVSDGRFLIGIRASNVQNLHIHNVEVFGLPVGNAIALNSITKRGIVRHCYIHDCTTALDTYGATPQLTGIEVDNNRVNGVNSVGLDIHDNHIEDLTFTSDALTTYGFQADGINVQGEGTGTNVHDNYVKNVGEGVDIFADEGDIHDNTLVDCYAVGVKLIHGASRNKVHDNTIIRPGLAGVQLNSSDGVGNVEDNLVIDNQIYDVDSAGNWAASDTAGVKTELNGSPTYTPNNNTIARNRIFGGSATMKYAVRNESGTGNRYQDNEAEAWATAYSSVAVGSPATIINAKKALVRVGLTSVQSTAAGVEEIVEFGEEEIDTQDEFNTTTHVYTAKSPRRIRVTSTVWYVTAAESFQLRIRKNGTMRAESTLLSGGVGQVQDCFTVEIGDTVDIYVLQGNGARDIGSGSQTTSYLTIEEVAC
jgi:hypothetical protein